MNLMFNRKEQKGFTLIELLITIAIIGILAGIAYPNYSSSVKKAHREVGKRTLLEAAQHMESYYAVNLNYTNAISAAKITGFTLSTEFSEDYTLTPVSNANTYLLKATPKTGSVQADDSCGVLSIDNFATTEAKLANVVVTGCW